MTHVNLAEFKRLKALSLDRKEKKAQKRVDQAALDAQTAACVPRGGVFTTNIGSQAKSTKIRRFRRSSDRKRLVARLDSVFSLLVRLRSKRLYHGACPFHETTPYRPVTQCFHFITRSKHSVRWDLRNAVGSCAACNLQYEHDQTFVDFVFDWYKEIYGQEAWDTLKRDSNRISKFSNDDLRVLLESLTRAFEVEKKLQHEPT